MNATRRDLLLQRWNTIQKELFPELRAEIGPLTPKLERVIHVLEWVRIEEFVTTCLADSKRPAAPPRFQP